MVEKNRQQDIGLILKGASEEAVLRWLVLFVAILLGGLAGLLSVVVAQVLMSAAKKHNMNNISLFGGVVLFVFVVLSIAWYEIVLKFNVLNKDALNMSIMGTAMFFLGLFFDVRQQVYRQRKLIAVLLLPLIILFLLNGFQTPFDTLKLALLISLLCISFYSVDSHNALVSGIAVFAIIALIKLDASNLTVLLSIVMMGTIIFMLFNITVDKIYLGQSGVFFLGSVIAYTSVTSQAITESYTMVMVCLLFYPLADMGFTFVRRFYAKKNLLGNDKGRLHNLIYKKLQHYEILAPSANTLTGLFVAIVFTGIPFTILQLFTGINWNIVYIAIWVVYCVLWNLLKEGEIEKIN